MVRRLTFSFLFLALSATGCSKAESHELLLTHPPHMFGEYTTQATSTADFKGVEISSSIPGRRPEYASRSIISNVILTNRREMVTVTVSNPDEQTAIAPQSIWITFFDGPTGEVLETLSLTTEVVPPGETRSGSITTALAPASGTYYWSYRIEHAENWEVALAEYAANLQNQAADDDDGWGDDDW